MTWNVAAIVAVVVAYVFWARGVSAAVVGTRQFDMPDGDPNARPLPEGSTDGVRDLAQAIAFAEGFGVAGAAPTRAHNPGDLIVPGWTGPRTGAEGVSVFQDDNEGWTRLHRQLQLIVDGRSRVYSLDMTIAQMAARWTDTAREPWASNVVAWFQNHGWSDVTPDTPLRRILLT